VNLERLTYEEAAARVRGAVVLLPTGSVEPHGPHLPLATDTIIAEEVARRAAAALATRGVAALVLPALPFGVTNYARGFAGVVGVSAATLRAAIQEIARDLAHDGARLLVLVNAHLEPDHLAALTEAAATARSEAGLPVVFPNITKRELASRLTDEFRSGACHGGSFETSLVLAARPDQVRSERQRALPGVAVSLSRAIREGKTTFHEAGLTAAYCGDPARATPSEGEQSYATLAALMVEAVQRELGAG
jgi:creatinine amidohydrolase